MLDQDKVDATIKNIFSDSGLVDVICSVYEQQLTILAIASLLNLNYEIIDERLKKLLDLKLVKKIEKENEEYFTLTYPKVCDSILMLKDAIHSIR
ncbi:MAG: hypothetical protein M1495_21200 [Bacteroidetes bacterium]|nr:hypothetical protein [Bacteroidota bacterium]MCL6097026.1 hypothetical protein [Bacteroidota bacterium]